MKFALDFDTENSSKLREELAKAEKKRKNEKEILDYGMISTPGLFCSYCDVDK